LSNRILLAALAALLFLDTPAIGGETPGCPGSCKPALRECLQQGRPALRACLRQCRGEAGASCPVGMDVEDCTEASGLQACVADCRNHRRQDIRACVRGATDCSAACRNQPNPTATPTPR